MKSGSDHSELSMMEAVNILTNMSEIDIKDFSRGKKLGIDEGESASIDINWKDPRQAMMNEPIVRETFRVLHRYLQNRVRQDQNILKDVQAMKGIQAIMILAQEAAVKMDRYAKLNPEKHKPVSSLKEYTDLQKYYKQQILRQASPAPETTEEWEDEIEAGEVSIEAARKDLSDLEIVRKDEHYELFFIKNENDKRYFNRSLLRHIRLIGNFDEFIGKIEDQDPLLQLREVLDREVYESARTMFQSMAVYIDEFYQEAKIQKDTPLSWNMNKALMALRMAATSRNLIENQSFKSCLEYYKDFHRFLRLAMNSPGYIKRITGEIAEDRAGHVMLRALHALCFNVFVRKIPDQHSSKWIQSIISRGEALFEPPHKEEQKSMQVSEFWAQLSHADQSIRHLLKHYPNGPILRILDAFREEEEFEGFDPLMHGNFPSQLFLFENDSLHLSVLRLPCPTKQEYINRAEIAEEFQGFLRFYQFDLKTDKHLIVNLQNRTSWEEFARCRALEQISIRAEYSNQLFLLGLAAGTSFFHQEDEYESMGGAPIFMEQFALQIRSGESCGYFLSSKVKKRQHEDFIQDGMTLCHKLFFDGKTHLSQKERIGFIEIFHAMYAWKMIDLLEIDSVSFTCKDAIDVGMAKTAVFYTFTRLVSDPKKWGEEEHGRLLILLYSQGLLIRERAILKEPLSRAIWAMEFIYLACTEKGKVIGRELNKLYEKVQFPMK